MSKTISFFFHFFVLTNLYAQKSPDELYDELFVQVQMQAIFEDSKTFPDCIPLFTPGYIMESYHEQKDLTGFNLKEFVLAHFQLPGTPQGNFRSDTSASVKEHIQKLWPFFTRKPDTIIGSSLIPLPFPYIIPGGRFREVYYWDSYFTMLGLIESGKKDLMLNMIDNFSFLIEKTGFVPNGNRTYYLSRSQPPFYSLMVRLAAEHEGRDLLKKYLPYLEKEYEFWMAGSDSLTKNRKEWRRVVLVNRGKILNRYWDDKPSPRPESYKEDVALASHSEKDPIELYRNLRAACESGWDFSSRWLKDKNHLESIHTTDIIPIDLNCLLLHLELTLAEAHKLSNNKEKEKHYTRQVRKRRASILKFCWDRKEKKFMDYDFKEKKSTGVKSLACAYPLFFRICPRKKSTLIKNGLIKDFLYKGGMVTTTEETGQQWDAPNGWAPLQWIVVKGLMNYGYHNEAAMISERWTKLNTAVYRISGKLLEKYNVIHPYLKGAEGEYPLQDGFGWTNGVFLKLDGIRK
jgi:alpha,alpha-trehalase